MSDLTTAAWEQKYQENQDRWHLGCPAPPFINLLASALAPPPGKIAVLGCGKGQDALLFSSAGFEVMGFDFAPSAIDHATNLAQARALNAQFLQRDIFDLATEFSHGFATSSNTPVFVRSIPPYDRHMYNWSKNFYARRVN